MRLELTTPPTAEPLSVAEVRQWLGIGSDVADAVVAAYIRAATMQIDAWSGFLGRALIEQTWTLYLPCFARHLPLPIPPARSIESIKYVDPEGVEQTLDPERYTLLPGAPETVIAAYGQSWPAHRLQPDAVRIAFVCGYGPDGSAVPENIRMAICLQVSALRSLSERNLFLSEDTVEGIGTQRFVVSAAAGNALSSAAQALLEPYRVIRV
ncbi:hypothetical protein X566_20115 [Afipia sp. P52-10]|uniref:head-tail connector protein n=1 Tax=Afipia sp. P52-10 TaxID=1429916 RepID=UPI0003DEF866|nr:hypothetical protein [Afipia sp. P52-10]ETR75910.1 hypothetical protein X566_20115 [Afipia sp. P52-10]